MKRRGEAPQGAPARVMGRQSLPLKGLAQPQGGHGCGVPHQRFGESVFVAADAGCVRALRVFRMLVSATRPGKHGTAALQRAAGMRELRRGPPARSNPRCGIAVRRQATMDNAS